ncbi:MAG: LysR family transcriptional regulator [Oscillospiraceae bacterium]|jgi:DNA-binding transcriptional LysR family regulator
MNDTQIQCFLTAARTLNFTQTADMLHFSPQAVSKNIYCLERELNVRLFNRTPRGIVLTKAGEKYTEFFSKQKKLIPRVTKNLQAIYQRMRHGFSIGYSAWIDPFGEINRGIKQFRLKNPAIVFSGRQYHNKELILELEKGGLDLVLLPENQIVSHSEFEICPIANEDISLYVPVSECGEDWDGKPDHNCWGLPFLLTTAWEWSYLERKQIIEKELEKLGINPPRVEFLPNIQSVFAEMQTNPCVTVHDSIFSYANKIPGICHASLGSRTYLFCIWHRLNENPIIPIFIEHMREVYIF